MRHLWSIATWEVQTNEDEDSSARRIGVPVTEYSLAIGKKRDDIERKTESIQVPLARDLYLLTAWYIHDFLDILNVVLTDPRGQALWQSTPKSPYTGMGLISAKAHHVIPISHLWYTVDGLYRFSFYFSNSDGRRSEEGYFKIVLHRERSQK